MVIMLPKPEEMVSIVVIKSSAAGHTHEQAGQNHADGSVELEDDDAEQDDCDWRSPVLRSALREIP
ncbi:MAG: hypothetical protein ACLU38_08145 [Dysosmobacter sp.]